MAISDSNIILKNYHGKIGNIILRCVGDKSVMSKYPDFSGVKWSRKQRKNRDRFKHASAYAKKILRDPEVMSYYKGKAKPGQNAQNMAISDYLLHPEIKEINVSKYNGQPGDEIYISAYDKFKVASVLVMILNATGFEVESGMADEYPFQGSGLWIYRANKLNPGLRGGRVVVRVTDSPGNQVKAEKKLDGT